MAVHTAVGQQADEMQRGVVFLGIVYSVEQRLVFGELAVLGGLGNTGQLLVDDAACADVGVADLAVAHLAVGKAHIHAGGADFSKRVVLEQAVQVRLICRGNGVALFRGDAKAVQNH